MYSCYRTDVEKYSSVRSFGWSQEGDFTKARLLWGSGRSPDCLCFFKNATAFLSCRGETISYANPQTSLHLVRGTPTRRSFLPDTPHPWLAKILYFLKSFFSGASRASPPTDEDVLFFAIECINGTSKAPSPTDEDY